MSGTGMLAGLGLGAVEEQLYLRLLGVQAADPQWLAAQMNLQASIVLAALVSLATQGLVEACAAGAWAAVPPDVAVEELLLRREVELRRARGRMGELMRTYRQGRDGTGSDAPVEVICGRRSVAELWRTLQFGVRERLRVLDRPPYIRRSDPQTELALLARGVTTRVVYHSRVLRDPERLAEIHSFATAGEQARVHTELPLKLALLDDRWALLPVSAGTELQSVLLIRPSTLLDALAGLFELYWAQAMRLPALPEENPEDRHRQLLPLLAAGLTDESIARQLGVSTRTVQRWVRELMDRFGARTRFQAGIQAARAELL
ncbi:LuxR C-terminal-related transcriptional regulator [Kitasatospora sp. NPDC059812]|uniref:LuxR C-terminal-related transcriptional regulator n=1 Tax=Kitasatospora sp. NPDC059812 TaxID=3346958 RepID=UPI003666018A